MSIHRGAKCIRGTPYLTRQETRTAPARFWKIFANFFRPPAILLDLAPLERVFLVNGRISCVMLRQFLSIRMGTP